MGYLRENAFTLLSTTTGIDATATGSTELYEVPAGKTMIPTMIVIRCTAFTVGSKAIDAVASFGGNSATYDDFLNSKTYDVDAVEFIATTFPMPTLTYTGQVTQDAGDSFRVIIETASDADTETWAVDLFGYLV